MCFSFFKAEGRDTGNSLVEGEGVESAKRVLADAGEAIRSSSFPRTLCSARSSTPGPRPGS